MTDKMNVKEKEEEGLSRWIRLSLDILFESDLNLSPGLRPPAGKELYIDSAPLKKRSKQSFE